MALTDAMFFVLEYLSVIPILPIPAPIHLSPNDEDDHDKKYYKPDLKVIDEDFAMIPGTMTHCTFYFYFFPSTFFHR
ncbi:hypothetical protein QBC38DRAFT_488983 [Podospora fimiseda]|uniref:Uncharacterized protein n=1 Tax=Podospora fimiseda TaxID=252190 RepID=A0AAN6YPD3_9PEZI|nr:hypothetical protein QBC38DRAFT_488983 [Podospora fimiseda]